MITGEVKSKVDKLWTTFWSNGVSNSLSVIDTAKTELLFGALFLRLLKKGGRAAIIVPDGMMFGSSNAHRKLREILVEEHKLDGVISAVGGV